MTFPDRDQAETFLAEVVTPALDDVASELGSQGATTHVAGVSDEHAQPAVELVAALGDHVPFRYRVQHGDAPIPAFGRSMPRGDEHYTRLEVHLRDGGQGYDVMGYTQTQLIDDALDQYERHLEFLRRHDGTGV
jgi:choline/glycine/proline betaine transport protein